MGIRTSSGFWDPTRSLLTEGIFFWLPWLFKKKIIKILFLSFRGRGKRERERYIAPNWGTDLQPRHVLWTGIEPAAFWFTGWCSVRFPGSFSDMNSVLVRIWNNWNSDMFFWEYKTVKTSLKEQVSTSLNTHLHVGSVEFQWPGIPFLGSYQRKMKTVHTYLYMNIYSNFIQNCSKCQTIQMLFGW